MNEVLSDKKAYISAGSVATVKFALGQVDEAFSLLEACETHDTTLLYIRGSPGFLDYQSDPRWIEIERKMGLPKS